MPENFDHTKKSVGRVTLTFTINNNSLLYSTDSYAHTHTTNTYRALKRTTKIVTNQPPRVFWHALSFLSRMQHICGFVAR